MASIPDLVNYQRIRNRQVWNDNKSWRLPAFFFLLLYLQAFKMSSNLKSRTQILLRNPLAVAMHRGFAVSMLATITHAQTKTGLMLAEFCNFLLRYLLFKTDWLLCFGNGELARQWSNLRSSGETGFSSHVLELWYTKVCVLLLLIQAVRFN